MPGKVKRVGRHTGKDACWKKAYIQVQDGQKIELYKAFFSFVKPENFSGIAIVEACRQKTMTEEDFIEHFGKPSRNYRQGTSFLYLYDYNIDNGK